MTLKTSHYNVYNGVYMFNFFRLTRLSCYMVDVASLCAKTLF